MTYRLHPEAALEHEEQVAYYEKHSVGLGLKYHSAMLKAVAKAVESPHRFRLVRLPDIRQVGLLGFQFTLIFREVKGVVQVLAVAHHRRHPDYWRARV